MRANAVCTGGNLLPPNRQLPVASPHIFRMKRGKLCQNNLAKAQFVTKESTIKKNFPAAVPLKTHKKIFNFRSVRGTNKHWLTINLLVKLI